MSRARTVAVVATWPALALVVVLAFFVAPPAANFSAPLTQRVFYFHVPAAWVAYVAFAVTAVQSARYLLTRAPQHDRLAAASAEVGLVFSFIALGTGLLWARVEFGGAYTPLRDAKVVTLVALMLAYVAYLTLRAGVDDPAERGRLAAAFGIVAFIGVPLSYLASRLSLHPDFTRPEQTLAPELGMVLGLSVALFTVAFVGFTAERLTVMELQHDVARLMALERGDA